MVFFALNSLSLRIIYNFTYRLSGNPEVAEKLTEKVLLMHPANNNCILLLKHAWEEFFQHYRHSELKGAEPIHQAFLALPPEQRCAVILRDILGYSYGQIGTVLNKSDSEAGNLISIGRQKITKSGKIPNIST